MLKNISLMVIVAFGLSACATHNVEGDPFEPVNRKVHSFNKELDQAVIAPVSRAYGAVLPEFLRDGVANVSDTLSTPADIVNNTLQGRVDKALINSTRLLVNVTFGLGGLFDVADAFGLPAEKSDFGETLYVWGVDEGAYVVLPLFGPSSVRDGIGQVVDFVIDPLDYVDIASDISNAKTPALAGSILDARYRYSDAYEPLLYESADSYEALKISAQDRRKFSLSSAIRVADLFDQDTSNSNSYDLYEDFYD